MAIRIRQVDGRLVALCAARSMPKAGDIYLDDGAHHVLSNKFARDFNEMYGYDLAGIGEDADLVEREESNNPNRDWWDATYGSDS